MLIETDKIPSVVGGFAIVPVVTSVLMVITELIARCCKGSSSQGNQSQGESATSQHLSFLSINGMFIVSAVLAAVLAFFLSLEKISALDVNTYIGGVPENVMLIILLVMNPNAVEFLVRRWDTWWLYWEGSHYPCMGSLARMVITGSNTQLVQGHTRHNTSNIHTHTQRAWKQ